MSDTQLPAEIADKIFQEGQDLLSLAPDNKASYIKGATAYAIEAHQFRQENEELKRQNEKLKEDLKLACSLGRTYKY